MIVNRQISKIRAAEAGRSRGCADYLAPERHRPPQLGPMTVRAADCSWEVAAAALDDGDGEVQVSFAQTTTKDPASSITHGEK